MIAVRSLVLMLALLATASAQAVEPEPLDAARDHYERGMSHYQLGEFPAAIDEFKLAYEGSHAPGLLFNLAQASRLAKLYEQALHFYRSYLRARPDAPNRSDAEQRIVELEPLVAAQRQRELAPEAPAPATRSNDATTGDPALSTPSVLPPPSADVALTPVPLLRPRDGRRERIAGLVTGGLGLGALAVGIYFGTQAIDAQNRLQHVAQTMGAWDPTAQSLYATGHGDAIAATTLYVAGAAAVGAGVALYVVGWRRDLRAHRFAVAPTPGGAQASFSCAF